jgi:hypothetical protein
MGLELIQLDLNAGVRGRRRESTMSRQRFSSALLVGMAVLLGLSASVEATSHDVGWTFGNVGSASYRLDGFEPDDAGLGANLGSQDPTLTVQIGKRYQVVVTNFRPHPFEVLAKGASAGADTILLAQGGKVGPFESDPEVAWEDNGSGTVSFTLTSGLHDAMLTAGHIPGYRCGVHVFSMRGDFIVLPAAEPEPDPKPGPDPLGDPIPEPILKGDITVELEVVASELTAPVYLTHAGDGTDNHTQKGVNSHGTRTYNQAS